MRFGGHSRGWTDTNTAIYIVILKRSAPGIRRVEIGGLACRRGEDFAGVAVALIVVAKELAVLLANALAAALPDDVAGRAAGAFSCNAVGVCPPSEVVALTSPPVDDSLCVGDASSCWKSRWIY